MAEVSEPSSLKPPEAPSSTPAADANQQNKMSDGEDTEEVRHRCLFHGSLHKLVPHERGGLPKLCTGLWYNNPNSSEKHY